MKKKFAQWTGLFLTLVLALSVTALAAETGTEGYVVVNTQEELLAAVDESAEKIRLGQDITLDKSALDAKADLTLDLDGHTLTCKDQTISSVTNVALTIMNGTIRQSGDRAALCPVAGSLTLDSVAVEGWILVPAECTMDAIQFQGEVSADLLIIDEGSSVKTISGGAFQGSVVIRGHVGTIEDCTISCQEPGNFHSALTIGNGKVNASVDTIRNCKLNGTGEEITALNILLANIDTIDSCEIISATGSAMRCSGTISTIKNSTLDSQYGAVLFDGKIGTLDNNRFIAWGAYGRGIEVVEGTSVENITNNIFTVNYSALTLHTGSKAGTITGNYFNVFSYCDGTIADLHGNTFGNSEQDSIMEGDSCKIEKLGENAYNVRKIPSKELSQEDCADALKTLGLFMGTDKGYELDRSPNRTEALTLVVRLVGAEEEAKTGSFPHPFTDVPNWASPYIGYAYAKEITQGVSDTALGSGDTVTEAQFLTFLLRVLGYQDNGDNADFSWKDPRALSDKLGLTTGEAAETFLRGNAVELMWRALQQPMKGQTTTLAQSLIAKGVFTQDAFNAAGKS